MKSLLQDNYIEMYATHNKRKSVVAERFIRTLRNNIYMTSISKNVYVHKLADIIIKYNNTYHSKIKMNPDDLKSFSNSDFDKENNKENPKFIVGDHVRISKYKDIFAKFYVPNRSEEYFVIKRVIKKTLPWTYVINDLNGEDIFGTLHKKRIEKSKSSRV